MTGSAIPFLLTSSQVPTSLVLSICVKFVEQEDKSIATPKIDNTLNKIGMFNKSFANMKRDYANGNGLLTSIFSGKNITSKDVSAIQAMNESMKNGSTVAHFRASGFA